MTDRTHPARRRACSGRVAAVAALLPVLASACSGGAPRRGTAPAPSRPATTARATASSPADTRASAPLQLPGTGLPGCSPIQVHPTVAGGPAS